MASVWARVLEAVPNFSEGRDLGVIDEIAAALESVPAVEVADRSSDPDHHRTVLTVFGPPDAVVESCVRAADVAVRRIDLRNHAGVHPRVGALDVLPLVPVLGLSLEEAAQLARRAGERIAREVGIPVYLYGAASDPPGRPLAEIRRAVRDRRDGQGTAMQPDYASAERSAAGRHASAGAVCVGARPALLAWNVYLEGGADLELARSIASRIRESAGGFGGLRALGFALETPGRVQVSMNLERPDTTSAAEVYAEIDRLAKSAGARAGETEVIGLIPDAAAMAGAGAYWRLGGGADQNRLLSYRVLRHLERRRDELTPLLQELSGPGPPAIGSALAWSGAMGAAIVEMCTEGELQVLARETRDRLAELGRSDAEIYDRFLVSPPETRLELLREVTSLPLEVGRWAARLRDRLPDVAEVRDSVAADLEGATRLLTLVARESARLALWNAAGAGSDLSDLEADARRMAEIEIRNTQVDLTGRAGTGDDEQSDST